MDKRLHRQVEAAPESMSFRHFLPAFRPSSEARANPGIQLPQLPPAGRYHEVLWALAKFPACDLPPRAEVRVSKGLVTRAWVEYGI